MMKLNMNIRLISKYAIIFMVLVPMITFAAGAGKVAGRVYDAVTGEVLPGANVMLIERWEGGVATPLDRIAGAATDMEGDYYLINISPGVYTLTCNMIGYANKRVEQVVVFVNRTTTINFEMATASLEGEEVVVIAEREVIKQDVSASKYYIRAEDVESLPLEGIDEILSTQLGISAESSSDGSGFSIRGGGIDETNIIIDGVSLMNERTQVPMSSINMSSIEEIEILSGGFNAEYGTVRSGLVNIVTKEGKDRISVNGDVRFSPAARKHFGPSPFAPDGPFWKVYAGDKAFTGVTKEDVESGEYPFAFVGWNQVALNNAKDNIASNDYTPQEALEIWKWRHREIEYGNVPDGVLDLTFTGPTPIKKLRFMYSQRVENTQYYLPLSRKEYFNSVSQLKLTYRVNNKLKFRLMNLYNYEDGVGGGSVYGASPAVLNGSTGSIYSMSYLLNSPTYLWAEGAFNPIQNYRYVGGLQMSYIFSPSTYMDLGLEYSSDKTVQEPMTDRDTTLIHFIAGKGYDEGPRNHLGDGAEQWDQPNQSILGGLGRGQNHSTYEGLRFHGTYVSQVNKRHQIKAGFDLSLTKFRERELQNGGGGVYTYEEAPSQWIYYTEDPIKGSAFIQDRLEFEGMVANFGLRADYYDPRNSPFNLDDPFNSDYTSGYFNGSGNGFDSLRTDESTGKLRLSPRLGISHPISVNAKIYFNYGHFYQVAHPRYYFNVKPGGTQTIPNLNLDFPKTIQYEVGYEHSIAKQYLVHLGAYYKDVSNEVVPLEIKNGQLGTGDIQITTWANNQYRDIRGLEFRVEKNRGQWFTFYTTFEYTTEDRGRTGEIGIYEDKLLEYEARLQYEQVKPYAVPSVSANLNFSTPHNYGRKIAGIYPLGSWRASFITGWSDGGKFILDETASLAARQWVEAVDWTNTDLSIEKATHIGNNDLVIYASITNLFNQKRLTNVERYTSYLSSLKLPFESGDQNGNDKYGDYEADYLELGWYSWTQFLNPRDVFIGMRFSF
ncbi:MAG: TonB-dependent receptor [Candidatus Marinimicrobia bacterium]|nr:TonB-dependent receptor [Candidatus Neomarinimicrobiota bacterium]